MFGLILPLSHCPAHAHCACGGAAAPCLSLRRRQLKLVEPFASHQEYSSSPSSGACVDVGLLQLSVLAALQFLSLSGAHAASACGDGDGESAAAKS